MSNLSPPLSYKSAPTATTSMPAQKGGRGYKHKRGCKCPLCKKKGGGDIEEDIETGTVTKEDKNEYKEAMKNDFNFAEDDDYNELDAAEKGESGPFKVGGSRRRKHGKKSKKGSKGRKTRRHSRKVKKHGRKSRRHR
jgi:hypothetical protein